MQEQVYLSDSSRESVLMALVGLQGNSKRLEDDRDEGVALSLEGGVVILRINRQVSTIL